MKRILTMCIAACLMAMALLAGTQPAHDVTSYGAVADGKTLNTEATNAVIAACSRAGGGTVMVPPGKYVAGPVKTPSNVRLRLEAGATPRASTNTEDFPVANTGSSSRREFVVSPNAAQSIAITGRGIISASHSGAGRHPTNDERDFTSPSLDDRAFAFEDASRNLPPAGDSAHQEEVRARSTNEWTRVGPLSETPTRTTDALPLSDQENKGDWVKYEPMSDEFEGGSLDTNKWVRNMRWWKGRQPALFKAENVTVSDGQLLLTMRKEPVPEEFQAQGYRDYTSAAVHSLDRTCYGYFEVKAKPMNSAGSSSFWFQQDAEPAWATEIDVFEIGGKARGFESKYNMNLHVFRTPTEKRHWNVGGCWTAPWRMADDYHIYGLEWNREEILYYVDGAVVQKVKNTHWHQPLYLTFDSETMPNWFGMPDDRDLPSTFRIEYVRAWKKRSRPTSAAPPTSGTLPRLKVNDNGRFLVTDDGKPFFWLGDTAWGLRTIAPGDVDRYMAHRVRHCFNVIQVHCGYDVTDYAGNRPFLNDNTDTPNEAFWCTMDVIVTKAHGQRLYVALVPMWGDEYGKAFGTDAEKAYRFGQWLGRRYAAHSHVLWIVSGEYDSINGFRLPISAAQKSVLASVARGLRDAHHGAQLMTIHPGVARTSSLDFHCEPWLDFNMLQSGHLIESEAYRLAENHTLVSHDYDLTPTKPVLDGEPIYEDTPDGVWVHRDTSRPRAGADAVRRKAYWAVFAGAFGHTYGHNDVYGFFKPAHPAQVQTLPKGPGQRDSWQTSLDAPGAIQMKHLRALIESRQFLIRVPDQSLVADGPERGLDHIAATRASDGSYAMVYFPTGKPAKIALNKLAGEKIRAWWFDPRTGGARSAGELERKGAIEFTPPSADDWVLVLDDASKQRPAPGSTPVTGAERLQWWREARFGLFVHWGPVSLKGTEISWSRGGPRLGVPAQIPGEVPVEVYDNLYKEFNPTNFNACQWVQIAQAAGMRYIVFTAKHCDGFCLWPTKVIDYHIGRTPFQRDICGELADAVHEAGLRLGWYYSPMDWYDPDCRTERNAAYVARMQAQLRELLRNYGRVDLLWFDRDGGPTPWDQPATYQIVKKLQPSIIINNRLDWDNGDYVGPQADYFTPEQFVGSYNDQVPWETCMTLGTQWSWKPGDTIKSVKETIRILARCAGGDGNLLLNVGPMPTGEIEPRQVEVLKGVGAWLSKCGESIYGTRGGPFKPDRYGACTRKANTLFLHIFNWCDEPLKFPAIPAKVVRSRVLTGGVAAVRQTDAGLEVSVPESDRHSSDTVVAIDLDGPAGELPVLAVPRERSLTTGAKATASNVFQQQAQYGADKAVDGNDESRWATDSGTRQAWLEVDFGRLVKFTRVMLAEAFPERVRKFELQYLDGADWKTLCTGGAIGECWTRRFEPVNARQVRLSILDATEGPTIWEFQLFE